MLLCAAQTHQTHERATRKLAAYTTAVATLHACRDGSAAPLSQKPCSVLEISTSLIVLSTHHDSAKMKSRAATELEFLSRTFNVPRDVARQIGFDGKAYVDFHASHLEYLRPVAGKTFKFEIEPDVQELGISNRDINLLDTCVDMLERGDRADLSRRVLLRYTNQTFEHPAQWRQ